MLYNMEDTIMVEDFQSICRCCLSYSENVTFFNKSNDIGGNLLYKQVSLSITKDDKFHRQLCQQCFEEQMDFHTFIDKWQRSEQKFLGSLKHKDVVKNEIISNAIEEQTEINNFEVRCSETSCLSLVKLNAHTQESNVKCINTKLYGCNECGKTFGTFSTLRIHLTVHTDERPHKCDKCEKHFKRQQALDWHVKAKHLNEKPHKCSFCEKSFVRNIHKVYHERTHKGEKPYTCNFCSKGYCSNENLKSHLRTHAQEKPHKCSFCGRGFLEKSKLAIHERIHTGEKHHACDVCEKAFSDRSSLRLHLRWHLDEMPYKCGFCKKGFTTKQHQNRHERSHTGEKPYTCDVCGKSYSDMKACKRHFRKHTVEIKIEN